MSKNNCTYRFNTESGPVTIQGMANMKAWLAANGEGAILSRAASGQAFKLKVTEDADGETIYGITVHAAEAGGNAFVQADSSPDGLYTINESGIPDDQRGKGLGVALYERLIEEVQKRGGRVASDGSVSKEAQRVYASLEKRGYAVTQSPDAEIDPDDGSISTPDGSPVYEVSGGPNQGPASEISGDQTQTEAFKRWFGDSKVVDADGKPLVVYHGTTADFAEFDRDKIVSGVLGRGFYFAANPESTRTYSGGSRFGGAGFANGGNVMPVYLSIKNPLILEHGDKADIGAESKGHDGVIKLNKDGAIETLVAFRPEQIKSAIGNSGAFDPTNPDIRFRSARSVSDIKTRALDEIHKTMTHPGKVSFWDRSVGTMRHLAERNPAFKPVFEAAQRFIEDVSMLTNDAADFAPRWIPRVETVGDIFGRNRKKAVSAEDNKAVAKHLFEGTLMWARDFDGKPILVDEKAKKYEKLTAEKKGQMMLSAGQIDEGVLKMWQGLPIDKYVTLIASRFESKALKAGVVWTDAELKSMFGATDHQISLYRESRAAIDRSIDVTTRTDMLRAMGEGYADMREQVLAQPTLRDAMVLLTARLQEDARANQDDNDRLTTLNNQVVTRYEKAGELMAQGYAPLSRFGKYTVDVVDAAGERQYFGMFETKRESNEMYAKMREEFPGGKVTQGTMSAEAYKLFAGITPESMELFGNMLGLESEGNEARDKAFQEYLKLAKNNHSALKRLIHRKGIAGYSEDVGRVLASFIYSNARQAAGGLNAGTLEAAVNKIPKEEGELKDVAMGLRSYIQDPQEEGQAVRGMLFAQYLGGSAASAFVNMTQPFAVTLPWLSQFGGMKKSGAQMGRALKDMATKGLKYESGLAEALKHAEDDGVVSPQEVHQLMAQARGAGAMRSGDGTKAGDARAKVANAWEATKVLWGQPFAVAEQFNRRITFIAAYRLAQDQKMANPADFARKAVLETQFLYAKSNKPNWARGTVGGTLFCVDDTTEALTQRGWAGPDDLRPGDMLASFDMATERLIWAPMQSVHIFDHDGEMVHAQSKTLDMLMTPDHRVVHYKEKRTKGAKRGTTHWEVGVAEAQDIPVSHRVQIPTAAPFDHVPVGEPITDAQARVIGWVVTEGWFTKKNRGRDEWGGALKIYQNEGRSADLIRKDLHDADLEYTETSWNYDGGNALHIRFNIKKTSAAVLREMLPGKQLTPALLMRMTKAQIEQLVDRMIEGDGSESPVGKRCLIQNPGPTLETFQMALTILGKSFRVSKHGQSCRKVLIRESSTTENGRYSVKKSERVHYTGRVWCPIVPGTSTWVARRNGMPFITHNTFKTYSVSYLELLYRMWTQGGPEGKRAVGWALAMLMLMGGAGGLPFMEDLEDLIDAIGQKMGYNISAKQWRKEALASIVGKELADFMENGVSGLPGSPVDVSGRLGLGNLLPGTGLLTTKTDHSRDVAELVGPAGDLVKRIYAGGGKFFGGDVAGAALEVSPTAVRNAAKGIVMGTSGMYKDTKGYKVIDTTLDEAVAKAIGFQPRAVAQVQEANSFMQRSKSFYVQTSSEIKAQWAQALFNKDDAALERVRERLNNWNENNPEQRITIKMPDIWKRVREMGKDRTERIADTAPKALRQQMRDMAGDLSK